MPDFIVRLAVFADEQKSTTAGWFGRYGEAYHRAGKRLYFFSADSNISIPGSGIVPLWGRRENGVVVKKPF